MAVNRLLVDDIGLEFEFPHLSEATLSKVISGNAVIQNFRCDHDGSTQRDAYTFPINDLYRIPVKYGPNLAKIIVPETCGAELVSPVIRTEEPDWIDTIKVLLDLFGNQLFGFLDPKCSFHVHVNMTGAPIYVLQNVIRIWLGIESLVFRLSIGEMGYHRGVMRRNFLYCRPISSPQVTIDQDGLLRPSYSYQSLLQARTVKDFFMAFNNTPIHKDPSKYNAVRYNALNFFNFIKYGTVEFRTFNLSYNWKYVVAWVNLSKAICKAAFGKEYEYPEMILGTNPENFDLETLRVMLNLDDWTMIVLYELFYRNSWVQFQNPSWQFTHLPDNRVSSWKNIPKHLQPPIIEGQEVRYYPSKHDDDYTIITSGLELDGNYRAKNLAEELHIEQGARRKAKLAGDFANYVNNDMLKIKLEIPNGDENV